jgi:hypothetical protein
MEKIPTAEEYANSIYQEYPVSKEIHELMIGFAKMHLKLAKNEINSNILHKELSVDWNVFDESGMLLLDNDGIKDFKKTVLNSYPLKKIK